jgi:diaminohydroxyphosphoribosylaminopyrimidine deaminase/5-amino-6-(5-phosphoribosylamino)uracil reductase
MTSRGGFQAEDFRWMGRALELAERGAGLTSPNPMVGAVIVAAGCAVGEGFHARAGGPHAEIEALAQAGSAARGATLYVTLEPCNHTGRTPPCADAVRGAGIRRVVAAMADPNPHVVGGGTVALSCAAIEVALGCRERDALLLNRVFLVAAHRGRPHVTLKWAATLDGKIADRQGASRWITGPGARLEAHRLRSHADAVIVGIGTALADDPALDVRLGIPWSREPLRVVVDSRARLPLSSRVIRGSEGNGSPGRAVVAVTDAADPERLAALEARGVTVLRCKADDGRVDISDLLARLGELGATGILVEGGGGLAGAFLEAGVVDRIVAFSAPVLLGGTTAPGALGGLGLSLPEGVHVSDIAIRSVGRDWVIEGDVRRRDER